MPSAKRREQLLAARGVYQLLVPLWTAEVDLELLSAIRNPPLREQFEAAGGVVPAAGVDSELLEAMAVEYCRLFIGPSGHLPPFQSVWQEGQLQSGLTDSMRQMMEVIGYPFEHRPQGLMPDHLGVQLDVMAWILARWSDAPDEEHDRATSEIARTFFDNHLSWPGPFLNAAHERATSDFYRSVIKLTGAFLGSSESAGYSLDEQNDPG